MTRYETLSEPVRKLVDGLTAIHDGEPFYRGRYGVDDSGRNIRVPSTRAGSSG